MQKWEYSTEFVRAHVDKTGWEKYRDDPSPDSKPPKYAPYTMIPELNERGEDGWELVHMQPVVVGKRHDVGFPGNVNHWSHAYFCAWKRPKQEADAE